MQHYWKKVFTINCTESCNILKFLKLWKTITLIMTKTVRFELKLYKQYRFVELDEESSKDCLENSKPIQIVLKFEKGKFPYPCNRNLTLDLKGFILFSLPYGEYPEIPDYDMERFDKMFRDWILENNLLDANSEVLKIPTKDLFFVAPTLKPWNQKTEIAIKSLIWLRIVDDFFLDCLIRSTGSSLVLNKEHFIDISRFITNIMTGLYRNIDCIPNMDIPFLNHALKAFFNVYLLLKENVVGYDANYKYVLSEIMSWIQSYKIRTLYMAKTWDQLQQANYIFKRVCSKRVLVEMLQLLTATYVEAHIRKNLVFRIFCNSGDAIQIMATDILCLPKDLSMQDNYSNIILRNTLKRGYDLEEALQHLIISINNEIMDFKRNGEALTAEFPNSQHLQRYIFNYQCCVDGFIRMYSSESRYGHCHFKIMKAVQQNNEE